MKDDGIYFLFENHPEFWTLLLCSIAVMVFSISRFAKLYMLYKDSEFNCDMLPLHSKYDESIREKYIRAFKLKYAVIATVSMAFSILLYLKALEGETKKGEIPFRGFPLFYLRIFLPCSLGGF